MGISTMIEPFLIKPLIAITLIAISSSLIGVFVVWKKLSFYGDALSHSILLGIVTGSILEIEQNLSMIIFAILFASLISLMSSSRYFAKSTIIMIISYFFIALAIMINDISGQNIYLAAFVFGDILTIGNLEIKSLLALAVISILFTIFSYKKILLINLNPDLAKISGIKVRWWSYSFLVLLTLFIALAVKIVGIFLITALLILPAAISRIFSSTAQMMLILSLVISLIISPSAFIAASKFGVTPSAAIIISFSALFTLTLLATKFSSNQNLN